MSFSLTDIQRVGRILASASDAEIMPRFRKLTSAAIQVKTSAFDVVTEADEAAEQKIAEGLRAAFPDAVVIGEEGAGRDPRLLDSLATADLAFLVDPIDGTKNFTARLALFGCMASAVIRGEVVGGAIWDPVGRDWAYAVRGEGAWLETEDGATEDLRVAAAVPPSEMHAVAGTNFLPEPLRSKIAQNLSKIGLNFWLRCCAHEYRLAAAGHCHLLVYNKLMPWDHAAGVLLHQEAGGYSAFLDEEPYRPTRHAGGLICAPDKPSWQAAKATLFT